MFLALFLSRKKICKCQLRKIQVASFLISLSLSFLTVWFFFLFSARVTRTPCHWARALRARLCLSFFQWEGTFLRKNGSIFCNTFFFMSFFCWISEILKFFCSFFCNVVVLSIIYGGLLFFFRSNLWEFWRLAERKAEYCERRRRRRNIRFFFEFFSCETLVFFSLYVC